MKQYRLPALLLAAMLLLSLFTGCAYRAKTESYDNAYSYDYKAPQAAEAESYYAKSESYSYEPNAPMEPMAEDSIAMTTSEAAPEYSPDVAAFAEKIIYSASLDIQTTEFDSAVASLERNVAAIGGFIESSNVSGDTRYRDDGTTQVVNRYAYYTMRVPAAQFESFLHTAGQIGNVLSTNRWSENVTSAYTDYEARLASLYTQEERLLEMLKKSDDVKSLIELESRLSEVRYQIESIERNLRNLDLRISFSTINLSLREVEIYTPTVPVKRTFGQKLANALGDGWRGFVYFWEDLTIGLAENLPALLILAAIVIAVIVIVRRTVKKHKAKSAAKAAEKPANPGTSQQ